MAFPNRNNFYSYMYCCISPIVLHSWTVGNHLGYYSKTYRFASDFHHFGVNCNYVAMTFLVIENAYAFSKSGALPQAPFQIRGLVINQSPCGVAWLCEPGTNVTATKKRHLIIEMSFSFWGFL